jgi:2,4-dienoyl-CoA reductase (NADPH2)
VLVVGGGPAGPEAARVAAERGHRVTLLERSGALGGQMALAARIPGRGELAGITRWLIGQVGRLPVEVRLETEATAELVGSLAPEAVVLATGSRPATLEVPGGDLPRVVDARAVLAGAAVAGEHVLVLDGEGYFPGLGAADYLLGRGKRVHLLTRALFAGDNVDVVTRPLALKRLAEQRCLITPTSWVRRVEPGRVVAYNTLAGWEFTIEPVDTVVVALPSIAEDGLYRALAARRGAWELHRIGDCLSPRHVDSAIFEGQRVARML